MRSLLWTFGILIGFSIVLFIVNPSIFIERGSMWTEYNDWNNPTSFDTTTYDLYKPVGGRSITIESEPMIVLLDEELLIELYNIEDIQYDGSWPYNSMLESKKNAANHMVQYAAVARLNNVVVAKNILYLTRDISEYERLEHNVFTRPFENGTLYMTISVLDYDQMGKNEGWSDDLIEFYKHWVYNDHNQEVVFEFELVER